MLLFPILFSLTPSALGVIGGESFPAYKYPWLVSIRYRNTHQCAGILYNTLYLITAAHCISNKKADWPKYTVVAAENNVGCDEGYEAFAMVESVHRNPNYVGIRGEHDIAVVQLDYNLITNPDLNYPREYALLGYEFPDYAVLVGWGPTARNLKRRQYSFTYPTQANLSKVENADCALMYPGITFGKHLACFGNKTKNGCIDSGAPLMCGGIVCGMFVKEAQDCGDDGNPGIFVALGFYFVWIEQVFRDNIGAGRAITKDPPGINVTTCGGHYETTQGNIKLEGLSAGQKCHFAIQTPKTEMKINLKESTMKEGDSLTITKFCKAHPCERVNMLEKVDTDLEIQASLIMVVVTIGKSDPSQPRGFTMTFNSTGFSSQVPTLTGFTVLNTSTSGSYSHPTTTGGKYGNNEVSLMVFDPPPENEKYASIVMKEIDIEGDGYDGRCFYDAVSVYAHKGDSYKRVTRMCGKKLPKPVKIEGGYGILSMITDHETVGKGFSFDYNYS